MGSTSNLRDFLLSALHTLPGTRELFLHVLVTAPRKHQGLFPFARPRPRAYLQDILILLSEQPTPDAPRLLTTAIEASVYNIPTTSCAILYISKVDSTGQATFPSPTPLLVRSLLEFYADPATRPSQYLFPNSADFSGKKPLSDVKLCAWWKRVLGETVDAVKTRAQAEIVKTEMCYALARASTHPNASNASWVYGHPYSQKEIPLPCPPPPGSTRNLGHFIPTFDDDPKSRFMDEIGCDEEVIKSPPKKRARTDNTEKHAVDKGAKEKEDKVAGELTRVSVDEFWERMSFRQECVAGAVTGFFTVAVSCKMPPHNGLSPLAPSPGQVSSQLNKRVLSSLMTGLEFSTLERAIKATESLEGSIKGLCEGIVPLPLPLPLAKPSQGQGSSDRARTPEPSSQSTLLAPPSTPPRRTGVTTMPDVSPNPFPEPVTSLETYDSYIFGTITVKNAAPAKTREAAAGSTPAAVTVLAVRKKRKPGK
ncbi:hypothetical protein HMN09_01253300 [Mycena chlorophos]|uniref:histone acetyltransferase n=1 Tax=Mycena chlorophos TaxID=658473 RepID=A0A8H6S383_MYCCL|nr:hypothetical protein HMN09_01253300 [Mycena chlorophos]